MSPTLKASITAVSFCRFLGRAVATHGTQKELTRGKHIWPLGHTFHKYIYIYVYIYIHICVYRQQPVTPVCCTLWQGLSMCPGLSAFQLTHISTQAHWTWQAYSKANISKLMARSRRSTRLSVAAGRVGVAGTETTELCCAIDAYTAASLHLTKTYRQQPVAPVCCTLWQGFSMRQALGPFSQARSAFQLAHISTQASWTWQAYSEANISKLIAWHTPSQSTSARLARREAHDSHVQP